MFSSKFRNNINYLVNKYFITIIAFSICFISIVGNSYAGDYSEKEEAEAAVALYLLGANNSDINTVSQFCAYGGEYRRYHPMTGKPLSQGVECVIALPACVYSGHKNCKYNFDPYDRNSDPNGHYVSGVCDIRTGCCECASPPESSASQRREAKRRDLKLKRAVKSAKKDCNTIFLRVQSSTNSNSIKRDCSSLLK